MYIGLYCLLAPIFASIVCGSKRLQAEILHQQTKQMLRLLDWSQNSKIYKLARRKALNNVMITDGQSSVDCSEIYDAGFKESGIYIIRLFHGHKILPVFCDMTVGILSAKKGWISIQRRKDGKVNFDRDWQDYLQGFGFPDAEHWTGLTNINLIIKQRGPTEFYLKEKPILRIKMQDWDGIKFHVEYSAFAIKSKMYNFKISSVGQTNEGIDLYVEPIGWLMHEVFGTHDYDPGANNRFDKDCLKTQTGGWWFGQCLSNLNGRYPTKYDKSSREFMYIHEWNKINPNNTALRRVSMMLQWR